VRLNFFLKVNGIQDLPLLIKNQLIKSISWLFIKL